MIAAGILFAIGQAASSAPPPVVVLDTSGQAQPVVASSWSCEALLDGRSGTLRLTGQFPAVSVEAQQNGDAFRLQATMKSEGDAQFSGTFPSSLTSNVPAAGIRNYSILIPGVQDGRPRFVLTFMNFVRANDGVVNVLQIDPSNGAPNAYAAGVCKLEAKP